MYRQCERSFFFNVCLVHRIIALSTKHRPQDAIVATVVTKQPIDFVTYFVTCTK
jgi:hypothetical protein